MLKKMKNNTIKVLYITHYSDLYGANLSMLQLILDLRETYQISPIVLLPKKGDLTLKLKENSIPYIICHFWVWMYNKNQRTIVLACKESIKRILNLFQVIRLLYKIYAEDIDIIHSNSSVINIGAYLHLLLGIPHVWHLREFGEADYNLKYVYPKKIVSLFFNLGANKCIAISDAIKEYYSRYIKMENIDKIYNGIKIVPVKRNAVEKQSECLNFCVVGLLSPQKKQKIILMAITELLKKYTDKDFHVSFIGGGVNGYLYDLEKYIKDNKLQSCVTFYGYRSDINELLSEMDVGIIASVQEAFGRVTVEYMLNYMPVIASNSGANPEIVDDGVTGILFENANCDSLVRSMAYMIENRDDVIKMGNKARDKACNNFSSMGNALKIYLLYSTIKNEN